MGAQGTRGRAATAAGSRCRGRTRARRYGFGSGAAWLPQPAGFAALSARGPGGAAGSTLELYRSALRLRRQAAGEETFTWVSSDGPVLHFERPGGWHCVTNFGSDPAPLPRVSWC